MEEKKNKETLTNGQNVQQTSDAAGQVKNPLERDIQQQLEVLKGKSMLRSQDLAGVVLDAIVAQCSDLSSEIMQTKAEKKGFRKQLLNIIMQEIVGKVDGAIKVFDYSERARSEQSIYLYNGLCWELLEKQRYYDFIRDCAAKCGLQEELSEPAFCHDLCTWVALAISRFRGQSVAKDTLINLANGTLEITRDGKHTFREHQRNDYLFYVLDYPYDPSAECPLFRKFLDEVLPDKDTQQTLKECIASLFDRSAHPEKMPALYGPGSNGKSVLLSVIEALVGTVNTSFVDLQKLTTDEEARVQIEHKLLNISYEAGRDIDPSTLKLLASGEPVQARELYKGSRTIRDYAKLFTSFNQLPRPENTPAFYRRFIILPFKTTIAEEKVDTELSRKLCQELSGILNFVLEALPEFLRRGTYFISAECQNEMNRYKMISDNVRLFAEEWCEPDAGSLIKAQLVFDTYKAFCQRNEMRPLGRNNFFERMETIGFPCQRVNKVVYFSLRLMSDASN